MLRNGQYNKRCATKRLFDERLELGRGLVDLTGNFQGACNYSCVCSVHRKSIVSPTAIDLKGNASALV